MAVASRPEAVATSPLLTELETLFDLGCYYYAAPDGALLRPARDNRKLASHIVAGNTSIKSSRPERTTEHFTSPVSIVLSGRKSFSDFNQPLRSWLISIVPSAQRHATSHSYQSRGIVVCS